MHGKGGICMHEMEVGDGMKIRLAVPGGILQSGLQALQILVWDDDAARLQALAWVYTVAAP